MTNSTSTKTPPPSYSTKAIGSNSRSATRQRPHISGYKETISTNTISPPATKKKWRQVPRTKKRQMKKQGQPVRTREKARAKPRGKDASQAKSTKTAQSY